MIRYYITDRRAIGGEAVLLANIERLGGTVDYVQIRERDLTGRALAALTRAILGVAAERVRVVVNDRADVALACGAHGVHLRGGAIPPARIRAIAGGEFHVSVACHGVADVQRGFEEGADLALLAPIFATPGKPEPLGLGVLAEAARRVTIPVLALGGVTSANAEDCVRAGAAGIAAIRLFQEPRPGPLFVT